MGNNSGNLCCISYVNPLSLGVFLTVFVAFFAQLPGETDSAFTPYFVWSAVNKTLDEDRLMIVDAFNERVKIKSCTKVVLYNQGSEYYVRGNYSGNAILIDTTYPNFSTPNVISQVKERMERINMGLCVPCIVVISIVNVSSTREERAYARSNPENQLVEDYWSVEEKKIQDYKFALSEQFMKLLQFRTPIQARHLVLVRLVERREDLTRCHGKKYTKYPRRLVSIWEQVLFDYFKDARVIQGATASGNSETTLMSGKESGIWVWMCEEIIRRLELQEMCQQGVIDEKECQMLEASKNLSTAAVNMANKEQCRVYKART